MIEKMTMILLATYWFNGIYITSCTSLFTETEKRHSKMIWITKWSKRKRKCWKDYHNIFEALVYSICDKKKKLLLPKKSDSRMKLNIETWVYNIMTTLFLTNKNTKINFREKTIFSLYIAEEPECPLWRTKYVSLFHLVRLRFCFAHSNLLTSSVDTHPDLGCGYYVVWTLRWPTEVDPFHPYQRSENSNILLLLLLK